MLPSRTLSISIRRPPAQIYDFVFNPVNLSRWAPGLCQSVRREGPSWIVETPQGPLGFRFVEPNQFGILDHYVQPPTGPDVYVPMRVVANGTGSEVLFTLFRTPDMSDEQFASDARLVEQDLSRLRSLLEG